MTLRLPLLFALGALAGAANAGIVTNGNPESLRGQHIQSVRLSAQVSGIRLTGRHGRTVQVSLPRGTALTETIPLPRGDWADLTLVLDGLLTVTLPDGAAVQLQVDTLTVPMHDPEATSVTLDWTLPAGASTDPAALRQALQDGGLAVPAP